MRRYIIFVIITVSLFAVYKTASANTQGKSVVLDCSRTFEEQVTKANCTYIIRDEFNQHAVVFHIPNNVVLDFKGGKLKNVNWVLGENVIIKKGNIEIADNGYIKLNNNSQIRNCHFSNKTHCKVGYGDLYGESCSGIKISKCVFATQKRQNGGKCSSIDLRRCDGFVVDKVTSEYTEGENIIVYDGSGVVQKCKCKGGWSGIGVAIYGASVKTPKQGDPSAKVIVRGNMVRNTLAAGITINNYNTICENNKVVFENCTVEGPGIRLGHTHTPATNCVVRNNIITWKGSKASGASTSNRGISIDAGNGNLVEDNKVENVPEGIASSVSNKTGTVIRNNTIKGASTNGVIIFEDLNSGNTCVIEDNDIRMIEGSGIWVRSCNAKIIGNIIKFVEGNPDEVYGNYSFIGLRIEDNINVETTVANNTVRNARKPIKAAFSGRKVILSGNKYYTSEEGEYTKKRKTIVEESNNRLRLKKR